MRLIYLMFLAAAMLIMPAQAHHSAKFHKAKAEKVEEDPINTAYDHDMYRFGGTYDVRPAGSADACASACNSASECKAWNFMQSTPATEAYCELKRGVGRIESNPAAISGLATRHSDEFQKMPKKEMLVGGRYTTAATTTSTRAYTPGTTRSYNSGTTYRSTTPTTTRRVRPASTTTTRPSTTYRRTSTPPPAATFHPKSTRAVTRTATRPATSTVTRTGTYTTSTSQPTKVTAAPRSVTATSSSTSQYYKNRKPDVDRVITTDEYYKNRDENYPEYSVQNPQVLESEVTDTGS